MTGYGSGAYARTRYAGGASGPPSGAIAGTFPAPTASISATFTPSADVDGTLSGTFPKLTGSMSGTFTPAAITGTLTGSFPEASAALDGLVFDPGLSGLLSASFPAPTGEFYGARLTSLAGLILTDLTTTTVHAAVEVEEAIVQHVVTPTVPAPVLVGGRPQ